MPEQPKPLLPKFLRQDAINMDESNSLIFLKLGGSLITDKDRPHTARLDVLRRLAKEIKAAQAEHPNLRLILGHGSGSFGHVPASRYGTRKGVSTQEEWNGFVVVWREARALNQLVTESMLDAGLPVIPFPPSATILAHGGQIESWDTTLIKKSLANGIIPLIFGDVAFDSRQGGAILSTEDLFFTLARQLKPDRILLAGIEQGVWADFPQRTNLVKDITLKTYLALRPALGGSASTDVTGGMAQKVESMLLLVKEISGLSIDIFSGLPEGSITYTINGQHPGTQICAE
jgi:isopentenyl phosphate kinase